MTLLALLLLACASEAPPPETADAPASSTATTPATELTDEQLLQEHPDYLDEALQQVEEVG